jgi:hypothetical protein
MLREYESPRPPKVQAARVFGFLGKSRDQAAAVIPGREQSANPESVERKAMR